LRNRADFKRSYGEAFESVKSRREKMMKKVFAVAILAFILIVPIAAYAGCGGNGSDTGSLSEPAKLLDNALREAANGNYQPYLELIPAEMRDTFAQMIEEDTPSGPRNIVEVSYRTEETDSSHVIVYYWGTFEYTENGETVSDTITEADAQGFPMVLQDGKWYLDLNAQMPQSE
jgi:hypothetical protein